MRTAAEESGPQDYKFSSTGFEPNDYFLTETCVEFNQESVTDQRFLEDLDYDDAVIGRTTRTEDESITLKEKACRRVCRRRRQ